MEKAIRIQPEAEEFLFDLPYIMLNEGYKSCFGNALEIVEEIINFIQNLNNVPHYSIPKEFEYHFSRYGMNLNYAFFKRKSSRKTTWYVFFISTNTQILVTHISNNWIEGHYIRQ
ncbi:MAG: hypothetical protein ACI4B3_05750 [Prevotella sp.]